MISAGIMHSAGGCDAGEQNALQGKAFLVTFFLDEKSNQKNQEKRMLSALQCHSASLFFMLPADQRHNFVFS